MLLNILAQVDAPAAPVTEAAESGSGNNMLIIMVLVFVAMYFLLIAPQKKKQKQHDQMIKSLETGDEIITIGGLYGKITNQDEKTYTIKVDDGTKIKILKTAVGQKIQAEKPAEEAK